MDHKLLLRIAYSDAEMKSNCFNFFSNYLDCPFNKNDFIITRLFNTVNCVLLQCIQIVASLSGTQTAAWTSTGFLPPKK